MSSARRTRWSGVLVPALGPPVLLRGTTGSVVAAAPFDAEAPAPGGFLLLENGVDNLLLENGTDQLLLEG